MSFKRRFASLISPLFLILPLAVSADVIDKQAFKMEDYKGQFVYMDFWASWCGPCRASFPWMNTLHDELDGKGLKIIAVNLDAEKEDAEDFLEEFPAKFSIIFNPEGDMAEQRKLKGMPSSYFFGPDGNVLFSHVGFNLGEADALKAKIRKAMADYAATNQKSGE